jgi:predicted phosphodiesterase
MRVLILGDVHGEIFGLHEIVMWARAELRIGAVIQVGDFGFFSYIIAAAKKAGLCFPVPVYAVDGNHEDHKWLAQSTADDSVLKWRKEMNLYYMPRPSILKLNGSKIGFLGGALHVDRPQNFDAASGTSNFIRKEERVEATRLFNKEKPELIVTHTCPTGIGIGIQGDPMFIPGIQTYIIAAGYDPGVNGDCGDSELTLLWKSLNYEPRAWTFGHFHADHEKKINNTDFVCIGSMNLDFIAIWDTDEKRLLVLKR